MLEPAVELWNDAESGYMLLQQPGWVDVVDAVLGHEPCDGSCYFLDGSRLVVGLVRSVLRRLWLTLQA